MSKTELTALPFWRRCLDLRQFATPFSALGFFSLLCLTAVPISGAECTQEGKLLPSIASSSERFGRSVDRSLHRVVVGADAWRQQGAAFIYEKSAGRWQETLLQSSDIQVGDRFGDAVSTDGEFVVVGASQEDAGGLDAGSVYAFEKSNGRWIEEKILASDAQANDRFGQSVDLSGNRMVVGASLEDSNGRDSGAAYVLERRGTSWIETHKLLASDGSSDDRFGAAVAIDGDRIIIGAEFDDENGRRSGAIYIYEWNGSAWGETKLTPSDAASGDHFGVSVAIHGTRAVAGAFLDDTPRGIDSGSAYVFELLNGSWRESTKLLAQNGSASDAFGNSVALDQESVLVGAPLQDDQGTNRGAIYVFSANGTSWQQTKYLASDGTAGDRFGRGTAITDGRAAIGAVLDDDQGKDTGSVYLFDCPFNRAPLCDAGGPYGAECSRGVGVLALDGSNSSDPDGDPLEFSWTSDCEGASFDPASADTVVPTLTVDGPPDSNDRVPVRCLATLKVNDGQTSTTCRAEVVVNDTIPPVIRRIGFDGLVLWAPHHKMIEFPSLVSTVDVTDACSDASELALRLEECLSSQPDDAIGDGHTLGDCRITTDRQGVSLRAERQGTEGSGSAGRNYTVSFSATDAVGLTSGGAGRIMVPHDRRKR